MFKQANLKVLGLLALGLSSSAMAAPVNFSVTAASVSTGAGYEPFSAAAALPTVESSDQDRLGVFFRNAFTPTQDATLSLTGTSSYSFAVSTLRFIEQRISANEAAGNLGVSVTFTFATPTSGPQTVTATGTATTGNVEDQDVDYSLTWNTLAPIAFGNGGSYAISLNNISFSRSYTSNQYAGDQTLSATVRLVAEPATPRQDVPEPGSLALVGAALALVGCARRRANTAP